MSGVVASWHSHFQLKLVVGAIMNHVAKVVSLMGAALLVGCGEPKTNVELSREKLGVDVEVVKGAAQNLTDSTGETLSAIRNSSKDRPLTMDRLALHVENIEFYRSNFNLRYEEFSRSLAAFSNAWTSEQAIKSDQPLTNGVPQ